MIGRSFTSTAIAVGETIRLTFDYRETSAGDIVRFGLFNTQNTITADGFNDSGASAVGNYAGYYTFLRDASSSANAGRFETQSSVYVEEGGTTIGSEVVNFDRVVGTQYSVVFDITRTSASQTDTLINFNNASGTVTHMSVAGVDTSGLQSTFNGVFLRAGAGTAAIDNVVVEVIPEPSTALLGALGALVLLRRRR